jgi:hypothetical protein
VSTKLGQLQLHLQLVEYGLHRHAIAPAIRELVALCFIQIIAKGCAGNERYRRPNLFRLTYRPAKDATTGDGTHEWRSIKSVAQAEALAQQGRREVDRRAHEVGLPRARARKKSSSDGFRRVSVTVSGTNRTQTPVTETALHASVRKPSLPLYLGRVGPSVA